MTQRVACNPYCVWYNVGHMHTFPTLARAKAFARAHSGRIGAWSDVEGWWIEINEQD